MPNNLVEAPQYSEQSLAKRLQHPAWDLAVKVAAPLAIAASACFYLAGYTWQSEVLKAFGLTVGFAPQSLQQTMTLGYITVCFYIIHQWKSSLLFCAGLVALGSLLREKRASGVARVVQIIFTTYQAVFVLAAILLLGLFAGIDAAEADISEVNQYIASNCEKGCMGYITQSGRTWGHLLVETDRKLVIVTRKGVKIIKADDLHRIIPRNLKKYATE